MGGRAGWLGLTMTMTKSNTTNTITSVTMRKLKAAANSDSPSPEESSPSSQAPPPPLPLPPALPLPLHLPLSPPPPPPLPLPLQTPTLPAVVQPTSATPPESSSVVKQASSSWWSSSTNVSGVVAAGVVAGVGLLILLFLVMLLVACCRRKNNHNNKRKKPNPRHHSYAHANYAQYHDHAHAHAHTKVQNNHKSNTHNVPSHVATGSSAASQMPYTYTTPTRPVATLGLTNNSFTYEELERATQGFSKANILGQGGFGLVHKGVLSNGKEVAVKSLKMGSGQGENEFQAEVGIISRVHHRHLVSLVGYCTAGEQRILVYEFVPNKTLEFHLHGKNQPAMDFPSRLKIALGSAKGIAYLHEDCNPRIFHRDIKAANILLEHDFEAKVADFGLAKMSNDKNTHVSTRVMGTFGYLAPEYAASGKLTEKSDVFSFGVVLLELITGRHPINPIGHKDSLVDWARPKLGRVVDEGVFDGVVDPRLGSNFNPQEMAKLVACAAASIRHSAKKRPKMSQIVRTLEGDMSLESLNEGVKPGESMHLGGESSSCEYNTSLYRRDLQYFRRALESENNSSSE